LPVQTVPVAQFAFALQARGVFNRASDWGDSLPIRLLLMMEKRSGRLRSTIRHDLRRVDHGTTDAPPRITRRQEGAVCFNSC
jgi:hypothetical protein